MSHNSDTGDQVLTHEQKQYYENDGYLVIKNLVSKEKIEQYCRRFQDISEKKIRIPGMVVMKDVSLVKDGVGEKVTNKLQDFMYDEVLFSYCQLPQVVMVVKDLIGGSNLMAMNTMFINKPPDGGTKSSRHPIHQDLHYFPFRPADRICCAWTALEHVRRANGCLVVLPGSHQGPLMPHTYPKWEGGVNKAYHGIQDYDPAGDGRIYVEMDQGDTVFFHPLLIHGSGSNKTQGFRKAISCHYANGDKCYYIDVTGTTQQNIADEVKVMARKRFKDVNVDEMDYTDFWRLRGRPVTGTRANL